MIKTKTTFTIFLFLSIFIFPYYIVFYNIDSNFSNSIIPSWNIPIILAKVIPNLIKFFILVVVTFYYWKLSKITEEIDFKKFLIHLTLTVPATLIVKIDVYQFITINLYDSESKLSQIQMVILINILVNILFFTGQILFGFYYAKFQKNTVVINE